MSKVFIVSAKRTAIGKFMGGLSSISPGSLGGEVVRDIIKETKIDPADLSEVIVGNVLSAGQGQGIGRQVSILGGVPVEVPGYSINILCGSGMKAIMLAYNEIKSNGSHMIIAGGVESMSQAPFVVSGSMRSGKKMGDILQRDSIISDGLTDAFYNIHMGVTAENIADKYSLSREIQDKFAIGSQKKAIDAVDSGKFKSEITPIFVKNRKNEVTFDTDEYPNRKTSLEKLSTLKTVFKKDGTVTAGNASGINDGASFMLIASEDMLKAHNLTPLVEIISIGQGGVDPTIMGMGPVPAINNALLKSKLSLKEMDLLELNEAFAAQSLGVITELSTQHQISIDCLMNKTNVNGGAIALGHPLGASGSRITTTLIHEMKRRKSEFGLASLCIGGGMGTAIILKNIK